jgi:AraC family transcriptional regulator of adaptative response / DNA-3-methyladenine glycosylase II
VQRRPSQRVVGAFDAHELAVRAVLGQHISVAVARTLVARVVERFGERIEVPEAELSRLFPDACTLSGAAPCALAELGIPKARCAAIVALSELFLRCPEAFEPGADPHEAVARLVAISGVGEWTAHYIAMRALSWPDAFPAGDLGVQKALGGVGRRGALDYAERWRPWRAYAVMHLWQEA